MAHLGVNIDHIATLRQARGESFPSPLKAALVCQKAGADQITVHLRGDARHIQKSDVLLLKKRITPPTKLNLEMSCDITDFAVSLKPDTATIVPENRAELTTEGGLVVNEKLFPTIKRLKRAQIEISLFVEPELQAIERSKHFGVHCVEIHTGRYANLTLQSERQKELLRIEKACRLAKSLGLRVVAGHGIDYNNIKALVDLGIIEEYNIGFSIVAKAIFIGLKTAVAKMKELVCDEV